MSLVASFLLTVGVIMTEITMMTMTEMLLVTFLDTLMMTVYVSANPTFITVITSGLTTFTYFDFYQLQSCTPEPKESQAPLCVPESDSVIDFSILLLFPYTIYFFFYSVGFG